MEEKGRLYPIRFTIDFIRAIGKGLQA